MRFAKIDSDLIAQVPDKKNRKIIEKLLRPKSLRDNIVESIALFFYWPLAPIVYICFDIISYFNKDKKNS